MSGKKVIAKNTFLIIFVFSFALTKAQVKISNQINLPQLKLFSLNQNKLFFNTGFSSFEIAQPVSNKIIILKNTVPKLPFICNMEDKFRNKFDVYLKIRAGNDESYMRMISTNNALH